MIACKVSTFSLVFKKSDLSGRDSFACRELKASNSMSIKYLYALKDKLLSFIV